MKKYSYWKLMLMGLMPLSLSAQNDILFISDNVPASQGVSEIVVIEYNLPARRAWIEAGNPANGFVQVEARDIPDFDSLLQQRLQQLGLEPDDPSDKGFTDLLESAGYSVRRSVTTREVDPFFGTEIVTQEFHGTVPTLANPGILKLSSAQLAELANYDLIIMSSNIGSGSRYSWAGGPSMELHAQWTGLTQPVISLSSSLIQTNEFGSYGWGWFYGFNRGHNAGLPYDRRTTNPRFVEVDLRPVVNNTDFLLEGLTVTDGRVNIYKDMVENPLLPNTIQKFSNNANFSYTPNSKVILSFMYPTFVDAVAGEITVRTPILARFNANERFFNPGAPVSNERILTPAGPRTYFAAGMTATGVFNLNEDGSQLFLNVVGEYVVGEPTPESLWTDTVSFENGWEWSPWYGWFNDSNTYPWIYHREHKWQYTHSIVSGGYLLFDHSLQSWLWVSEANYPWIYKFGFAEGWYYYNVNSSPRTFYRGTDNVLVNESQLTPGS